MDFGSFGVDMGILVATVGISEYIKTFDKENKLKRFYIFLPGVLSVIAGVIMTDPFTWQDMFVNVFKYFGIATFAYGFIKKVLMLKMGTAIKKAEDAQGDS